MSKYDYLLPDPSLKSKYSEHSEDVIIESVFKHIKPKFKTFVDVGAYGIHGSNTYKLIENGWRGILIEGRKDLVDQMKDINAEVINEYVTRDNLDSLLPTKDIDLLNIDIDSYDYEVWKNSTLEPTLVCIEVNQFERDETIIDYDPSYSLYKYTDQRQGYGGATIGLLSKLADEKGYDYLTWCVSNVFYIKR